MITINSDRVSFLALSNNFVGVQDLRVGTALVIVFILTALRLESPELLSLSSGQFVLSTHLHFLLQLTLVEDLNTHLYQTPTRELHRITY